MERVKQFQRKLKYIYIMLLAIIVILSIQSNIVYANTNVIVEADYADGTSYTSSGSGEWYSTYCKGAGYKGQGVLVYMLERNGGGAVAGVTPKAFPCSSDVKSIRLSAQDKYKNYSAVTTWESNYINWASGVPVGKNGAYGAIMKNSLESNVGDIKAWLLTKISTTGGEESTNGIKLVDRLWGADIAQRFADNEIVFIAEPIVAVQYSMSMSTDFKERLNGLTFNLGSSTLPSVGAYTNNTLRVKTYIDDFLATVEAHGDTTGLSGDLSGKLTELKDGIAYATGDYETTLDGAVIDLIPADERLNRLVALWSVIGRFRTSELTGDKVYQKMGTPIAGTPNDLVQQYKSLSQKDNISTTWQVQESGGSWYRRSANSHTFIRASRGAILFNGSGMEFWNGDQNSAWQWHSDSNIENITIGMLAMMAWNDPEDRIPTESQYVIHESEIAKPIETEDELSSLILGGGSLNMTSLSDACNGHRSCVHSHSDSCKDSDGGHGNCSHSCSESSGCITHCSSWTLTDNSLTFKLKNDKLNSYPKILLTTGSNFKPQLNNISKTRGTVDSTSVTVNGYKYKVVVYRGNDKLNYAEYKNNINKFDFTPTTIKTAKTRKEEDYTEELNFYFTNDGSDTTTSSTGSKGCTDTDTIDLSGKFIELNKPTVDMKQTHMMQ